MCNRTRPRGPPAHVPFGRLAESCHNPIQDLGTTFFERLEDRLDTLFMGCVLAESIDKVRDRKGAMAGRSVFEN